MSSITGVEGHYPKLNASLTKNSKVGTTTARRKSFSARYKPYVSKSKPHQTNLQSARKLPLVYEHCATA